MKNRPATTSSPSARPGPCTESAVEKRRKACEWKHPSLCPTIRKLFSEGRPNGAADLPAENPSSFWGKGGSGGPSRGGGGSYFPCSFPFLLPGSFFPHFLLGSGGLEGEGKGHHGGGAQLSSAERSSCGKEKKNQLSVGPVCSKINKLTTHMHQLVSGDGESGSGRGQSGSGGPGAGEREGRAGPALVCNFHFLSFLGATCQNLSFVRRGKGVGDRVAPV